MPKDTILYERKHIIIKEHSLHSEVRAASLDEITGTITVYENEYGKFFSYVPLDLEDAMTNDWALINGGQSVVAHKHNQSLSFVRMFNSSFFF